MSYQDQSSLRFSLEESIWFKKGQEVEELFSISLDPQITISERDQFVYIQGHLELSGEYQSTEEEAGEEDYSNVKFVREILNRENGECEFYHNFPIDVTIPKNRIENMDDVEIYIDSFDYDLPEKACLKLTVDLSISGIYGEQQNHGISALGEREQEELIEVVPRVTAEQPIEREENFEPEVPKATGLQEETAEEEQLTEEPEREIESFTFSAVAHRIASGNSEEEAKKEPIVSRSWNEESDIDREEIKRPTIPSAQEKSIVSQLAEEEPEKDTISELEQNVTTESTVPEIVLRAEEKESEPVLEEEKLDTQVQVEEEQEEEVSKLEVIKAEEEHLEESSSSIEEIKEKTNKWKKGKKYESISLTDFFARKEEENAARLRVCIVQKGETIDTLAERYRLNAQQIIKVNQLETTQDVYEGQVLYIPVSVPAEK